MSMRKQLAAARIGEPTLHRALALLMFGWIAVVFLIAVVGYRGDTFTNAISFRVDDGWCVKGAESLGAHCFGDYGYARSRGGMKEVYSHHNIDAANSPLTVIVFESLRQFGYRTGLVIYTMTLIGAVAIVAWWGARRRNLMDKSVLYFAAGVASLGALVAVDRGNPVTWLATLMLAYIVAVERRAWGLAAAALAVLAALKFWGILLIVVLLAKRQYSWAARALALTALLYLVPLFFLPTSMPNKIKTMLWAVTNRDYADAVVRFAVSPYSLLVRTACYARGSAVCDPVHPAASIPGAPVVAVVLSLGLAVWAYAMCRGFDGSALLAYGPAISLAFLAVPEAGVYNLVVTVVMFALLARYESDSKGNLASVSVSSDRKLTIWAMVIAMAVATVPIPLVLKAGTGSITLLGDVRVSYVAVPVAWMVVVALTTRLLISERRASNRNGSRRTSTVSSGS
ncbi:MAG TPA: glycosyltransferase 87 family protein, partial [Galbitalea sp.]